MMTSTRLRASFLSCLLFVACKGGGGGEGDPGPRDPVVQLCVDNCLKPLCMGNIDVEGDYESVCESRCEMKVAAAEAGSCMSEYEDLLTCLDETSCGAYYLWYDHEPDAPCMDLETDLVNLCPDIVLREFE